MARQTDKMGVAMRAAIARNRRRGKRHFYYDPRSPEVKDIVVECMVLRLETARLRNLMDSAARILRG